MEGTGSMIDHDTAPAPPPAPLHQRCDGAWWGPPRAWVMPALLPWKRLLAGTSDIQIMLAGVRVWPEAFTLEIAVFSRRPAEPWRDWLAPFPPSGRDTPCCPQLEVRYPRGIRALPSGPRPLSRSPGEKDVAPGHPVLRPERGEGDHFHYRQNLYIWPLPEGPVTLSVSWREVGIPLSHVELDGNAIRDAAAGATEVWPDLPQGRS
jgi:hypothetical protein